MVKSFPPVTSEYVNYLWLRRDGYFRPHQMADDITHMEIQHGLVRLGSSTGWPDQEIDVILNDFCNGRCALGIGEDRVLRDLEGLAVGV
jgi:hypothetical protein